MKASIVVLSKLVIIGWASVWVAALPLFHTHLPGPFGMSASQPHTVFSVDLPGEFSAFNHRAAPDDAELSAPAFHTQELGFVASTTIDDGKRKPLAQTAFLFLAPVNALAPPIFRLLHHRPVADPDTPWASDSHGLRAPPAPVSA